MLETEIRFAAIVHKVKLTDERQSLQAIIGNLKQIHRKYTIANQADKT